MLSNTLRVKVCYLKIINILHTCYHPKISVSILKNEQKNKCVCIHANISSIIMKMKMIKKNRSHIYDINRPRSRHRHKHSKYKKCLSMTMLKICIKQQMLICIKQHLNKIWSSIHEKVKQHWDWIEKSVDYKKACTFAECSIIYVWWSYGLTGS